MTNWISDILKQTLLFLSGLGGLTVILSFFWTNVRLEARRLTIVDLATKRLGFWRQFMETAQLVTEDGSSQRIEATGKVYQAILQVHRDAQQQTAALVRNKKIFRKTDWRAFKPEFSKIKPWYNVVLWFYYTLLAFSLLFSAMLLGSIELLSMNKPGPGGPKILHMLIVFAVVFVFLGIFVLLQFLAASLKHEEVTSPIIDSI